MNNIIKLEISNCINSTRFKIMFSTLFGISILNFLMTAIHYYGSFSNSINLFYLMGILQGNTSRKIFYFFLNALPLIVGFIYSDSYYIERKTGINISLYIREGRKKYLISKLIVTAMISFVSVFFILFINELLTFITYRNIGSNINGMKVYEYINRSPSSEFLSNIKLNKPVLYSGILILVNSLYASILATFSYTLTIISKLKGISIIVLVTIGVYLLDIVVYKLGLGMQFSMLMYQQGGPGDIISFLILIILWIASIGVIFNIGIRKDII